MSVQVLDTCRFFRWLLLLLIFVYQVTPSTAFAIQSPLVLAYPEYQPFFYRDASGGMRGFFYEIVTEAFERLDVKSVWQDCPWKRCQLYVRAGEADAMITVPTVERAEYTMTHPEPFYEKSLKVFTYEGHPRMQEILALQSLDDILDGRFTVITYIGNGWHADNVESRGIQTYATPNLVNVWKMLENNRGDLVIEWPYAAWNHIEECCDESRFIETDVELDSMPFHLLISKNSKYVGILDEFNRSIREMKNDGTIRELVGKYYKRFERFR